MQVVNLKSDFFIDDMQHIFVYGSLLFPEITKKLTGKSFKTFPAILEGYKMYGVRDCDYPAIVQQEGSKTVGLLIENMDDLSLAIISFYEGEEYEKRQVTVNSDSKSTDVLTFVWVNGYEFLVNEEWDFRKFEKSSLEHYLDVVIPETLEAFYRK